MTSENSKRPGRSLRDALVQKTPFGRGRVVLYLDFDGVLHHENALWHPKKGAYLCAPPGHRLFQHVDLLAEMLEPYPELLIVLSTSWVLRYGYSGAAKRLPAALRRRVVGSTFHSAMNKDDFRELARGKQIWADVVRRLPRRWLALDDRYEDWPEWCLQNLIRTDEILGISAIEVQKELRDKLRRVHAGELSDLPHGSWRY